MSDACLLQADLDSLLLSGSKNMLFINTDYLIGIFFVNI